MGAMALKMAFILSMPLLLLGSKAQTLGTIVSVLYLHDESDQVDIHMYFGSCSNFCCFRSCHVIPVFACPFQQCDECITRNSNADNAHAQNMAPLLNVNEMSIHSLSAI
jgi:hypothetical protein